MCELVTCRVYIVVVTKPHTPRCLIYDIAQQRKQESNCRYDVVKIDSPATNLVQFHVQCCPREQLKGSSWYNALNILNKTRSERMWRIS